MTRHPGSVGRQYASTSEARRAQYQHGIDEAARYEAQVAYERNAIDDVDTSSPKPVVIGFLFLLVAFLALGALLVSKLWVWCAEAVR